MAEVRMNIRGWKTIEEGEALLREWDRRDACPIGQDIFDAQSLRPGKIEFIGELRGELIQQNVRTGVRC